MAKKQDEAKFRSKAMQALRTLPNTKWFRIEQQSLRGTPDCIGCIRGQFVAIEFKRSEEDKATPLQMKELQDVAAAGGRAYVLCPENWLPHFRGMIVFAETGQTQTPDGRMSN